MMSFATTTSLFPITFGTIGQASVGLNARNVEALGVLEPSSVWSPAGPDFSATIVTLDPLNQQQIGNHGHLVATIPPAATSPVRGPTAAPGRSSSATKPAGTRRSPRTR